MMGEDLQERVRRFTTEMEAPAPRYHTSEDPFVVVHDLWREIERHSARIARLEEALGKIAERAENTTGTRDGAFYRALIWIREHARAALKETSE